MIIRNSRRYRIFFFNYFRNKRVFSQDRLEWRWEVISARVDEGGGYIGDEPDGQGHRRHDERRGQK